MIVVTPPRDHHFQFKLDRTDWLAGRPGLTPLGKDDPVDAFAFEAETLWPHAHLDERWEADEERLILGEFKDVEALPRSLATCTRCHQPTVGPGLLAKFGSPESVLSQPDADRAAAWLKRAMLDGMAPLVTPIPVEVEVSVGLTWAGD